MPWTCPKCGLAVGYGTPEQPLPKSGGVYSCPVCRLELVFDGDVQRMSVVSEKALDNPQKSDSKH